MRNSKNIPLSPENQRFISAWEEVKKIAKLRFDVRLLRQIGYSSETIISEIKLNRGIPTPLMDLLADKYKLNKDFITTGKGQMFFVEPSPPQEKQSLNKTENDDSRHILEDETDISSPSPTKKTTGADIRRKKAIGSGTDDEEGLVYVPIAAQAGYSRNFTDPVFINQLERIYVPGLPYKGDNFRYFEVEGDSMHPTIQEGMQVIAQRVDLSNWDGRIKNFYIHVIVTDSQILIKRLAKKDQKQSHFAMISDNDLYPQEPIRVEDIKELWYVKRILDWRMAPPKHFEILV